MTDVEFNYQLKDGRTVEVHAAAQVYAGDYYDERYTIGELHCDVYYYIDPTSPDSIELFKDELSQEWDAIEQEAAERLVEQVKFYREMRLEAI